jgi:GntR family transcriptional regulator
MWFHIDPASGAPIYLQLVEQVKQAVVGGVLRAGQRLPATRDLAIELAVNPNTIVKAYQALEREGVIELPRGKGAFVASRAEGRGGQGLALLRPSVERLVAEAYRLGVNEAEVLSVIRDGLREARERRAKGSDGGDDDG